jgi:hypothetical protein
MRRSKVFGLILALGAVAVTAVVLAVPSMAANGVNVLNLTTNPTPVAPTPGNSGYDFVFWNGNGDLQHFAPTSYNEVTTPIGNTEVLTGSVANDTGKFVTYWANSGGPIPAGQTCWDFATGKASTAWLLTITAAGHYTLSCTFPRA